MAIKLTNSQRRAVETRDKSILLSAAAGSGKTATLTRRITESLTDSENPSDLQKMLIVTFTRAAAAELRERIAKALNEALAADPSNEHLNRQSIILGSASICTIDSFCLDLVRSNFQRLKYDDGTPVSPDFRLADGSELDALRLECMNTVINNWYSKEALNDDFPKFIENFTNSRDEGNLVENLISYTQFIDELANGDSFTPEVIKDYEKGAVSDYFDTDLGNFLREYTVGQLDYYINILEYASDILNSESLWQKNYLPTFAYDLTFCKELKCALEKSYGDARDHLLTYSPPSLRSLGKSANETTAALQKIRTGLKDYITKTLKNKYFLMHPDDIRTISKRSAESFSTLNLLSNDFRRLFASEKRLRRICEFNDIRKLAHKLLINDDGSLSDIAYELRERYTDVYIDEYQDVDRLQDDIFSAVSNTGCRFVVGDIKQSIYAFRGADPSIFGDLRVSMPPIKSKEADEKKACSIFMSENFRCDENVIKFVNLVSRHTFVPAGGSVGYRDEDDLIFKKNENFGNHPVTVAIMPKDSSDSEEDSSAEIRYVVSEIKELLSSGKKNDGTPIKAGDIAILCRTSRVASDIAEALTAERIENSNSTASDFFGNPEIMLVLSLFSAIDNPQKDVHLASVLLSDFFSFKMEELLKIKKYSLSEASLYDSVVSYSESDLFADGALREKCAAFIERLTSLREESRHLPLDKFVRLIYREFSIMSLTDTDSDRPQEYVSSNLRHFYEYARKYSFAHGGNLSGFIRYINDIIDSDSKVDAPSSAVSDAVTLMTIHKSKGLEYPVVFVCGCSKSFFRKELNRSLLFDQYKGAAMNLSDTTGFAHISSPFRNTLRLYKERFGNEEELRVFYVAMTRARERLYITAEFNGDLDKKLTEERLARDFECRSSTLSKKSYFEFILGAICYDHESFRLINAMPQRDEKPSVSPTDEENVSIDLEKVNELRKMISERFSFEYPYAYTETLPAKLSVSRLYPDILDDDGAAGLSESSLPELYEAPAFMLDQKNVKANQKGTATHVFLQFCDFELAACNVEEELNRLVAKKFIPSNTAELVNINQLERFFKSDFYNSVKDAKKLYREQRFNLLLPASKFTSDEKRKVALENEKILVQGVIDLFMIDRDGRITLCDYKTDHLSREELSDIRLVKKKLFDRHGQQLRYYAEAIKALTGKRPDRICVYSLPFGEAIDFTDF